MDWKLQTALIIFSWKFFKAKSLSLMKDKIKWYWKTENEEYFGEENIFFKKFFKHQ